ncbi:Hypothetical protein R9X50_00626600 [Acrodontium crateriforme]|uniref:Zn(2)-C6 fungal-type domain-containing protein n=1 Tax=Acrodontium crateriforme TaxID=150365 RepID=A0AAQ3M7M2_9PEZI|nr:Hypothetical protein R9X50_00626600 [Acrodontium crateriforme]
MALPPVAEHESVDVKAAAAAQASRRKRRRTTAGGANDDCFSCRKNSLKCGRERPYCSQCMHAGLQCGGYKTTLTWGVGVASRGKLRGLSCPVANKNADGSDVSLTEMEARRRKNSVSKVKREDMTPTTPLSTIQPHIPIPTTSSSYPTSSQPFSHSLPTSHSHTHSHTSQPIPIPQTSNAWQIPGYFEHVQQRQHDNLRHHSFSHRPMQRLQTAFAPHWDGLSIAESGGSVDSFTDRELHSPLEFSSIPRSMSLFDRLPSLMEGPNDHCLTPGSVDAYRFNRHHSMDHYTDPLSGSLDSLSNASYEHQPVTSDMSPLDTALFSSTERSYDPFDVYPSQANDESSPSRTDGTGMSLLDTTFSSPFYQLSPRMQSLMDYYDVNVCPYLVAFDGPENPYRRYILQLAGQNRGLQNAIAALSTNNLRMRRKESRSIAGFAVEITDAFDGMQTTDFNEPSAEESFYKQMSIDQLNMQLTDPRAAQDDSVLATLLILCLFHVCDSGFSKFKTQLAGMQKLLSMRDPSLHSDFTQWVEMFFIWFDVMTSTVNDREVQITGESLDMLDFASNLGALEQFAGCDGRLFKLIARLGRLNLLAQGRPVRPKGTLEYTPRFGPTQGIKLERKESPVSRFPTQRTLSGLDYETIDGNGWGSHIVPSDEEAIIDEEIVAPDERREFWSEWYEMRTRLQSWQVDLASLPSPSASSSADQAQIEAGQRDMMHINESFRYSALLYIERLGHPILPSSHFQFQHLVSQGLYHITALPITSCVNKFLLWPLFIMGTECVDEEHRNIIRSRCIEVQKESGFFNNISALEVLERVWAEAGPNVEGRDAEEMKARMRDNVPVPGGKFGQAFRWRKAMDRAGGEYIVI